MSIDHYRLEARYHPALDDGFGSIELALFNLSSAKVSGVVLAYSSLTRLSRSGRVDNGGFLRRLGNLHEIAMPDGMVLAVGGCWKLTLSGLTHAPKHRLDGPKSAYLTFADGRHEKVSVGDMLLAGPDATPELKHVPEGRVSVPVSLTPWPQDVAVERYRQDVPVFCPAEGTDLQDRVAMTRIGALAHRLFRASQKPFDLLGGPGMLPVRMETRGAMAAEAYQIDFAPDHIQLAFADAAGRDHGLITLAQMRHGAIASPGIFRLPETGRIADVPRYGWRGSHLDVSRHFWPKVDVLRFLDILAWLKMNVLQWHLTDDEGWRLEIRSLPELTGIGACRGPDCEMVPQHGIGAETYAGHYSQADVAEILARAADLHIDVVPEIDIPGHCTAVLHAYPHLRDPDEPADNYRSIQGYPNNALNPAMPETYVFLESVLAEVAALFPSDFIHVGGDEVDTSAWLASPLAQGLMAREGLTGTMELQAHLMKKVQAILARHGKKLAGWDEVSHGGGVDPAGTLLVAWQKPEVLLALAQKGYDVVSSPGQAYYMDMVQADGWMEPGASWAGTVTPQQSYEYEAVGELPADLVPRLKGVQAGIWCEHLFTRAQFNHMVFPRLGAVAEAGWTDANNKNWQRFAALSRLLPSL